MPNFERYDNRKQGYSGGGRKMLATLTGNAAHPELNIGGLLREQGFDTEKRYALLWDAETLELGLEPCETGFKVQMRKNSAHTSMTCVIAARGFCARFGIKERLECLFASELGDTWILKMKKVG